MTPRCRCRGTDKNGLEGDRLTLIARRVRSNHTVQVVAVSENVNEKLLVDTGGAFDDVSCR